MDKALQNLHLPCAIANRDYTPGSMDNKINLNLTTASRPTPNSVGHFSAKLSGGAAQAHRCVSD